MPQEIEIDARTTFGTITPRVAAALEVLWRRQTEGQGIEAAAKELKVHRTTLLRWFGDDLGMSPKQAIRRLRMTRAIRLMAETNESLTVVAMQAGYGHFQSMARHFRETLQATPNEIRRRQAANLTAPAAGPRRPAPFSISIDPIQTDHRPLATDS